MAKKAVLFNPRCKQWSCPYCAELNKDEWLQRGLKGALDLSSGGNPLQFVTLTSRGYATPIKSLYYFKQNWPKLVRRAKYHTNKDNPHMWAFFLIPERTRAEVLHAHIITTGDLSERFWKDNAYQTGFGYQAHVEILEYPQAVAGYIVKYLGKDVVHTGWPKGFRRVRCSRNWPKISEPKNEEWNYSTHTDESAWFEYFMLKDYGYEVEDRREK